MAHTIVGKLNKSANEIPTQNGVGFGIRLGVQYYNRETKKKEWTNYEAVIFASQPPQIQFYKDVLVEGSVIEISGESLKIKQFQGQNGLSLSLELIGAKLGYVHAAGQTPQQPAYQQSYAAPQQQYAQPQQAVSPQGQVYNQGFAQPQQQQQYAPQQNQQVPPPFYDESNPEIPF